jgi:hypothetical protein
MFCVLEKKNLHFVFIGKKLYHHRPSFGADVPKLRELELVEEA